MRMFDDLLNVRPKPGLLTDNDIWDQVLLGLAMKNQIHKIGLSETARGMAIYSNTQGMKQGQKSNLSFHLKFANQVLDNKVDLG